ncbi:hypothetical protein SLS53_004748 [Cytospora paraplurivora]|uniref:Uncharacterized protein n=1 Tax=Cytospora paraplurivora TaxID=2898453 RepID=A0AAN9U6U1_9PEZI
MKTAHRRSHRPARRLAVRKELSHDAKKLNPAKLPAKAVPFQYGSKFYFDYIAYKAELAKIKPVKDAYLVVKASARFATDLKTIVDCLAAARSWKDQAVK